MASEKNETVKKEAEKKEMVKKEAEKSGARMDGALNGTDAAVEEKKGKTAEPVYTVEEFCGSAQKLFGVRPECVRAAFRERGVMQCGKTEAARIVRTFMKKEVV